MNLTCPECNRDIITTEHSTSYELEEVNGQSFEAIIYTESHVCDMCWEWWTTTRRGYYRVAGEVLKKLIANQQSVTVAPKTGNDA